MKQNIFREEWSSSRKGSNRRQDAPTQRATPEACRAATDSGGMAVHAAARGQTGNRDARMTAQRFVNGRAEQRNGMACGERGLDDLVVDAPLPVVLADGVGDDE